MMTNVAKKLKAALLSAAVVMACAGQAQAATFQGDWDPAFGNAFPGLGWRGNATVYVPQACIDLSKESQGVIEATNNVGGQNNPNCITANPGGQLDLLTANVELYDINSPLDPDPTLRTLSYNGTSPKEQFIRVWLLNGSLLGVSARYNEWATPVGLGEVANANYSLTAYRFDLEMNYIQNPSQQCFSLVSRSASNPNAGSGPSSQGCPTFFSGWINSESIAVVPEPGTLAMLLPAVGMLAAFRRRRLAPAAA